jgi:hypothetical protein
MEFVCLSIFGYKIIQKVGQCLATFPYGLNTLVHTRPAPEPSVRLESRQFPGGDLDPVWAGVGGWDSSIFAPGPKLSGCSCERLQNMLTRRSIFNVNST